MAKPVTIGARGEAAETVEHRHTLTYHHEQLPPVYSTPDMIRLMETAAFWALAPFCEPGELTVGTHINIEHRAAASIGAAIRAEATVESITGRFLTLRVTVHNGPQEIGRGTVERSFINVAQFMNKVAQKNQA